MSRSRSSSLLRVVVVAVAVVGPCVSAPAPV
jgi:hypothetical protein